MEPEKNSQVPEGRRLQITRAALDVLGREGSKGLTHRAVDAAAGVPAGTSSNFFRTRSALLGAALNRHVELDTPPSSGLAEIEDLKLDDDQAKQLILAAIDHLLRPEARHLVAARYELVLESTRRHELKDEFAPAREKFIGLSTALLKARGCETPRPHAAQLTATIDGILLDQLLDAPGALTQKEIAELVERQLRTC